jgi:hypothetical protein
LSGKIQQINKMWTSLENYEMSDGKARLQEIIYILINLAAPRWNAQVQNVESQNVEN